jgi:hypothetical protein
MTVHCVPEWRQRWVDLCVSPTAVEAAEKRQVAVDALTARIEKHKHLATRAMYRKRALVKLAEAPVECVKALLGCQLRCQQVRHRLSCIGESPARCGA